MHVEKVTLRNVLRHKDTTLELPSSGVVSLTGPNGHGKSSLVEAVSVALWGETLRGTSPWSGPDAHVYARVRVGDTTLHVTRTVKKGKAMALSFHEDGKQPVAYETATKAQQALELHVGEHAVWRRASVFSSSDADGFSSASDGERKRMLESVLGVDRFDPALKACRADLQKAEIAVVQAERDASIGVERLSAALQRKDDAEKALEGAVGEDADALDVKVKELRALLRQTDGDLTGMRTKLREGDRAGAEHAATARQLHQTLERLRGAKCPTCEQPIPEAYKKMLGEQHARACSRADGEHAKAKEAAAAVTAGLEELTQERDELAARVSEHEGRLRAAVGARQQHQRALDVFRSATESIVELEASAEKARAKHAKAQMEVSELRAAERVLGLKGPRSQIVSRALGGLEAVANTWLTRVAGPGLSVRLSPFTETKTAGVNDKIAFEVVGVGNGHGYRAASGGERRRLDVALLLALGEFVAAAAGRAGGTLFADEVFDALDDEGRAAVSRVLHDLAEEGRTVVVVTHLPAFVRELAPDERWAVERGVLRRA